jgi:hypothetical protein
VEKPKDILSALHFGIKITKSEPGVFYMCENDMRALAVTGGDIILALDINTGQWCAAVAQEHTKCGERTIIVSDSDASLFGFGDSTVVNLVRYEGEMANIEKAVMSYSSPQAASNSELASFMHLHKNDIRESIKGVYVGIDTKLRVGRGANTVSMGVKYSNPQLLPGQVGKLPDSGIDFKPHQAFGAVNVVLCISKAMKMKTKDVSLKTIHAARTQLEPLIKIAPEIRTFLDSIKETSSRAQIAALSALLIVNTLLHNRTEGRFALVTFNEIPEKFSIQRGKEIQSYVEFYEDLRSEEVLISLIYSIIDVVEEVEGFDGMSGAYRSIAEYLEDFGPDRPTIALVMSNGAGTYDEEHLSFLNAISKYDRYKLDILTLGNNGNQTSSLRLLKGLNSNLIPVETFSSHMFTGYFLDLIDSLVTKTTDH